MRRLTASNLFLAAAIVAWMIGLASISDQAATLVSDAMAHARGGAGGYDRTKGTDCSEYNSGGGTVSASLCVNRPTGTPCIDCSGSGQFATVDGALGYTGWIELPEAHDCGIKEDSVCIQGICVPTGTGTTNCAGVPKIQAQAGYGDDPPGSGG